jgi:hypothetical protein
VIASRNKIFCVFHPAKAITQTNWSEGDTLLGLKAPPSKHGFKAGAFRPEIVAAVLRFAAYAANG